MENNNSFLIIGDPHFKVDNIEICSIFIKEILSIIEIKKPKFMVILGDLLHTHERLHTSPLNKIYEFLSTVKDKLEKIYIIVGNHDMISNTQFLNENHWMNFLKNWKEIEIIDKVKTLKVFEKYFLFCPYVFPGRFEEALSTIPDWKECDIIFCHQEFYGCQMGAIISENGDKWDEKNPMVISGHIHDKQKLNTNIIYPGSSIGNKTNIVLLLSVKKKISFEEIELNIPIREEFVYNLEEIHTIDTNEYNKNNKIRITLKCSLEEFKSFKKTKKYKEFQKENLKLVFKPNKIEKDERDEKENEENFNKNIAFENVLLQILKAENNENVEKMYDEIRNEIYNS
jgi:DNA repair exonuclease SbcCD nuclease subunit